MEKFQLEGMDVEATFIREKYGLFRWDFNIYKKGELVAMAADYNSQFPEAIKAAQEFLDEISEDEEE